MKRAIYMILVVLATVQCSGGGSNAKTDVIVHDYKKYLGDDTLRYYHLQKGLFSLLSQCLPRSASSIKSGGFPKIFDESQFPCIFAERIEPEMASRIDTLRFDWNSDTIIVANYGRDLTYDDCEMISTCDYIKSQYQVRDGEDRITHEYSPAVKKYINRFVRYLRTWDEDALKHYFPTYEEYNGKVVCDFNMYIGRIIIKNGRIVSFDHRPVAEFYSEDLADYD